MKLNILLTNDDSYQSNFLHIVKEELNKICNVIVIAPKEVMSAKSCSCTLTRGLEINEYSKNEYWVDGTPSDCVNLGNYYLKSEKNINVNLVVSGCNKGENISYDDMYSGTIGACLEASKNHIPSIAFSAPVNVDLDILRKWILPCFQYAIDHNLIKEDKIISFNFPLNFSNIKGIKETFFEYRDDIHYYSKIDGKYVAKRTILDAKYEGSEPFVYSRTDYISCLVLSNNLSVKN